jgi:broad specificity phosphatase PhoE
VVNTARQPKMERETMFLQRHGESETNISKLFTCRKIDPSITENGRKQIEDKAYFYRPFKKSSRVRQKGQLNLLRF